MPLHTQPVGTLLRDWRQRRRLSQLSLALEAGISQRHLSCVESGKARPSRGMLLHLADRLDVPLRERNTLLAAAGFAPAFAERHLGDPALAPARHAVERVLTAHEPWPALAVDRHWRLVSSNRALPALLDGCDPALLTPPVNVLRLALHPGGVAPRIRNLAAWRGHVLARLQRQAEITADRVLIELLAELRGYPGPRADATASADDVAVLLHLETPAGELRLLTATLVLGTPLDVTLAELAIEIFLPADAATAALLRASAGDGPPRA